jgi:large subunit ribosomal protein L24
MGLKALNEKKRDSKVGHIKKNDKVVVLTGRSKGKQSRVIDVRSGVGKVLVEGVAMVKRHTKPNPTRNIKGGIMEKESYIDVSNVMVVCPNCGKPTRVAHQELSDGHRARACKKCGSTIDKQR